MSNTYTTEDAIELINAHEHADGYAYLAGETSEWVAISHEEMAHLAKCMAIYGPDAYSHWAHGMGRVITEREEIEQAENGAFAKYHAAKVIP